MQNAFDVMYALCIPFGMTRIIDIKTIRRVLGLSQAELGQQLGGVSQGTVSRLETGAIKPRGLVRQKLEELQARAGSLIAEVEDVA
jgi:predicted transcriptional regulator